jgi:DNA-binding LytR/AlgR family response regulator
MIFALASAAAVGVVAGFVGYVVSGRRHSLPWYLFVMIGAGGATAGVAAARMMRVVPPGPVVTLLAPLFFAALALAVTAVRMNRLAAATRE